MAGSASIDVSKPLQILLGGSTTILNNFGHKKTVKGLYSAELWERKFRIEKRPQGPGKHVGHIRLQAAERSRKLPWRRETIALRARDPICTHHHGSGSKRPCFETVDIGENEKKSSSRGARHLISVIYLFNPVTIWGNFHTETKNKLQK